MNKKSSILFIILLSSLVIGYFSSSQASIIEDISKNDKKLQDYWNQELDFTYNSTYQEKIFHFIYPNASLDQYNFIKLYFVVLGDQSTNEGLFITFQINNTETQFKIGHQYQNEQEHNITRAFYLSQKYEGDLNVTIVCGGQSYSSNNGTLVISQQTKIASFPILTLNSDSTDLPIVPEYLWFQGSMFSSKSGSVISKFICTDDSLKLNLSLSFMSNHFFSASHEYSIILNNLTVEKREFKKGTKVLECFFLSLKEGINTLEINFTVFTSIYDIKFYDICLVASVFSYEEYMEEECFDYIQLEGEQIDHVFSLQNLKPDDSDNVKILHFKLQFRFLGEISSAVLSYEIVSGIEEISSGKIIIGENPQDIQSLKVDTYTTNFDEPLLLRINGSTVGQGYFLFLKTSKIITNTVLEVKNGAADRLLAIEEKFSLSLFNPKQLNYYDVFKIPKIDSNKFYLLFSFKIAPFYISSINYLDVKVTVEGKSVVNKIISPTELINETQEVEFVQEYNEIRVSLIINGNGDEIRIYDVFLKLISSLLVESFELPIRILYGLQALIGLYGAFILKLTAEYLKRRKKKRGDTRENQETNETNDIGNGKEKIKSILYEVVVPSVLGSLFLLFLRFVLKLNFVISIISSIVYALLLAQILWGLELDKISIKDYLREKKWFFEDANSLKDLFVRISKIISSYDLILKRIGVLLGVFVCGILNIGFLKVIAVGIGSSQQSWISFWFLFSIVVTLLFILNWKVKLALNFTFFEDNLKRIRRGGILIFVPFLIVWGSIVFLVIIETLNFFIFRSLPLTILFGLNIVLCNNVGRITAEEMNEFPRIFRKRGVIFTRQKDVNKALVYGYTTRKRWSEKESEFINKENEEKLRCILINDVEGEDKISLTRLAELIETPKDKTETYLLTILDKFPSLGKYNSTTQNFVKNKIERTTTEHLTITQERLVEHYNLPEPESGVNPLSEDSQANEVDETTHFIKFDNETGLFQINTELVSVVSRLKQGDSVPLITRNEKGEEEEQLISFDFLADTRSSVRILTDSFLLRLQGLVKQTNETAKKYYKEQEISFSTLDAHSKSSHLSSLAMRIMVELSVSKIFTKEQFKRDAVLFWNDDYDSFVKKKEPMDILSANLSTTLKGEFAIIMVFLQSILIMYKDSFEGNRKRFSKVKEELERKRKEQERKSLENGCLSFILIDYYNPFIKHNYTINKEGITELKGWSFVSPEERSYNHSIWSERLPFTLQNNDSVVEAIEKEWQKLSDDRKEGNFKGLGNLSKKDREKFTKKNYGKDVCLVALYTHLRFFVNSSSTEFKEKIEKKLGIFPTNAMDWVLYIIDRQIQWINRGQDMFGPISYLLMRSGINEEGQICSHALPNPSPNGHKWLREGLAEIEMKSGWDKGPKALESGIIRFTNNPEHDSSIYLSGDTLHRIAEAVIGKEFDVLVKHKGRKRKVTEILGDKLSLKSIVELLKNEYFNIIFRSIDRVDINTTISTQKHLLRRLMETTEKYLHLSTSEEWLKALTSKKENSKQFFELVKAVVNDEPEWKGLKLQKFEENNIVREIFSEFFSSLLYYNILLFASGLPVLQFNQELLKKGFHLPQTISFDKEKQQIKLNTDEPPVYSNIRGRLTQLVYGGANLSTTIIIPKSKIPLLVDISHNTFQRPIYVRRIIEDVHLEEKIVFAPRIIEDSQEKVIILDSQGFTKREIVLSAEKRDVVVLTTGTETVYGAVVTSDRSLYGNSYARQMLVQLFIYGGMHSDGKIYEAIIELFNKNKLDELTQKSKQIPFLFFSLISSTRGRGKGQLEGLKNPVKHQLKKVRKRYSYQHRPEILGVALTNMEEILCKEVNYSIAFGSGLEKYDLLYWNRSAKEGEKDVRYNVKGKNGYVNKFLSVFQEMFRNAFNVVTEGGGGGEKIHKELWRCREGRKFRFSFAKEEGKECKEVSVKIPLVTTNKYSKKECYFSLKTIAQRIPHILLNETKREKREFLKKKIAINFLLMINHVEKVTAGEIDELTWEELKSIAYRYSVEKNSQIEEKDWAKVIMLLFPELIVANRLVSSPHSKLAKAKTDLRIDFSKINITNPSPDELTKIFPQETRSDWNIRTPYSVFFNIFGNLFGITWSTFYKESGKLLEYPRDSYNKPDVLIEPIFEMIVPWIIIRAQTVYSHIKGKTTNSHYISKINDSLVEILKLSLKDVLMGEILQESGTRKEITLCEKLMWFWVWEAIIIDTISFNLYKAKEIMELLILMVKEIETETNIIENIDSLLTKARKELFNL